MRKVKTNRRNRIFGLFAMFAMAIGVGVSLAPKEIISVSAATAEIGVGKTTAFTTVSGDLDANFAYNSYKGGGTTAPAVNSGSIRLYQKTGGGEGGYITVSPKNDGYKMTSITVTNSMGGPFDAYYIASGAKNQTNPSGWVTAGTTAWSESAYTYTNTGGFTHFKLICKGDSSTTRVYVASLSIVYEDFSAPAPEFGTLTSISIKASATKTSFEVGQTFSSAGLEITASDNSSPVVKKDLTTGFSTDYDGRTFAASDIGTNKTVTVSYTENGVTVETTYQIDVTKKVLKVTLVSPNTSGNMTGENQATTLGLEEGTPFEVYSVQGDAGSHIGLYANFRIYSVRASGEGNTLKITIGEGYVITGVTINYTSTQPAASALIKADDTELHSGTGYVSKPTFAPLSAKEFTIKNTHSGGSSNLQIHIDSIEISFNEAGEIPTLEGLSYTGTPITSYLAGDSFDPTGLSFEAEFSDDSTLEVATNLITFSPDPLTEGTTTVVAKYVLGEEEASVNISGLSVIARPTLSSIAVTKNPTKMVYYVGESFDKAGMEVTASFSSGPTELVTSYTVLPETFATVGTNTVTISYDHFGIVKSTTLDVEVIAIPMPTDLTIDISDKYSTAGDSGTVLTAGTSLMDIFDGTDIAYLESAIVQKDGSADEKMYWAGTNNIIGGIQPLKFGSSNGKGNVKLIFSDEITITSVSLYVARRGTGGTAATMQVNSSAAQTIGVNGFSDSMFKPYTFTGSFGHELIIRNNTNYATYLYGIDIEYTTYEEDALVFANEVMTGSGNLANGSCETVLDGLEDMYDGLTEMAQLEFETSDVEIFVQARARMDYLRAWVASQSSGGGSGKVSTPVSDNSLTATIIIGVIGLTTLAGYYFIQKKQRI